MKKIKAYVLEVYDEMKHKVAWPSWTELRGSALVVSVASLIIALIVLLMDLSCRVVVHLWYFQNLKNLFSF